MPQVVHENSRFRTEYLAGLTEQERNQVKEPETVTSCDIYHSAERNNPETVAEVDILRAFNFKATTVQLMINALKTIGIVVDQNPDILPALRVMLHDRVPNMPKGGQANASLRKQLFFYQNKSLLRSWVNDRRDPRVRVGTLTGRLSRAQYETLARMFKTTSDKIASLQASEISVDYNFLKFVHQRETDFAADPQYASRRRPYQGAAHATATLMSCTPSESRGLLGPGSMSVGESGHREASGRGALRVSVPPPSSSSARDQDKKRAKRAKQRQKAEAEAKASASKTDETDPDWRRKQERAVEQNARTKRMYTNFLRVAKQLWVNLPSSNWCSSDYDVTMPDYGKHVDPAVTSWSTERRSASMRCAFAPLKRISSRT